MMKNLPKLFALLLTSLILCSCTNDEGETEFDIIDPGNDQQPTATE